MRNKYDLPESINYFKEEKEKADSLFTSKDYIEAIKSYSKLLDDIKVFSSHKLSKEEDLKEIIYTIGIPVNLNIAKCYLKQKDFSNVFHHSNRIIELEEENIKARYMRCLSALNLDNIDIATKDFDFLKNLKEKNFDLKELTDIYLTKVEESNQRRKKLFKKMIIANTHLHKSTYEGLSFLKIISYYLLGIKEAILYPLSGLK